MDWRRIARAKPDGQTVAALNNSIMTILPHLQRGRVKLQTGVVDDGAGAAMRAAQQRMDAGDHRVGLVRARRGVEQCLLHIDQHQGGGGGGQGVGH